MLKKNGLYKLVLVALAMCFNIGTLLSSEPEQTFYIVRHGQTDWNLQKKVQGQTDIPLNDNGKMEAKKLADELKDINFTACFSSDLQRAYETAYIITQSSHQPLPIKTDSRMRERNFGSWEGHLSAELYSASLNERLDVESNTSIQERTLQCLEEIAIAQPKGSRILVVSHGGVIRCLILRILELNCSIDEIETKNASVLKLSYTNGKWKVESLQGITLPANVHLVTN